MSRDPSASKSRSPRTSVAISPGARAGPEQGAAQDPRTEIDVRQPVVGVVMGSDSDYPVVARCLETLEEFDIPYDARVMSAHRTPDRVHAFASTSRLKGFKVLIAAAGGAAHLAGVLSSLTTLPVIGIPLQTESLGGADALYSTVQMPAGVPVATVSIGEAGARNAALLAAEILALADDELQARLQAYRARMRRAVRDKSERLRQRVSGSAE